MLEGRDFEAVDGVFPFVAASTDRAKEYVEEAPMTTVHTAYSDLLNRLLESWTNM